MLGIRVLDSTTCRAGAYCTRLLAGAGAEVLLVEPPGGHPLRRAEPLLDDGRSAAWAYLSAGKELAGAARGAPDPRGFDVAVISVNGDPADGAARAAELRAAHPGLVVAALSPFGLTGPYAGWRGAPLVDWASGGYLALCGEADRYPLPGGGPWATHLVGSIAAVGVQAALRRARRDGRGDLVDVGAMGALACAHQWSITLFTHQGVVKRRWGNRVGEAHHPLSLHPCRDGWVCIASVTRPQWEGLCLAMDHPELLLDEALYVPAERFDRADQLDVLINGWTATRSVSEVVAQLQDNFCPAAAVRSLTDNLADPHLEARGFWVEAPDLSSPARMPAAPFRLTVAPDAAPEPPEATEATAPRARTTSAAPARGGLPLAGLRVVEFSIAWAGPLAGRMLADLGADVVKVEHPTARGIAVTAGGPGSGWDAAAWRRGTLPPPRHRNGVYPDGDPGVRWWNRLGHFNKINRGKRSLCLDVKAPGGRDVLDGLVRRADVVFNNYSPRGVRSLGIDHASLRRLNPRVVTVDLSGFGAVGPAAEAVSWGPILDAASGLADATGYPGSGPYKQGLALPDAVGGFTGAFAILAALHHREVLERAVHVDLSQLEAVLCLAGDHALAASLSGALPPRRGARSALHAPQGVYPCAGEDGWVALSVDGEAAWAALRRVVGGLDRAAWADPAARRADHDAIDEAITTWTRGRDKRAAMAALAEAGVPASAVMTNRDLVEDPHLAARGFLVTLDQADCGPLAFPGFPVRFDETPVDLRPTPALGAHNEEILGELGFSPDAIAALAAAGAIAWAPPDAEA
ncbi:MAG: CoA transferase [Acidimicrobiales bacterium]